MEVVKVKLVLMLTVISENGEDLTDDQARATADAMLEDAGDLHNWIYNGVERRNHDEVIVVYVGKKD